MDIDKGQRWTKTGRNGAPLQLEVASEVFDLMGRDPPKKPCVLVVEAGVRPVRRMRLSTLLRDWRPALQASI